MRPWALRVARLGLNVRKANVVAKTSMACILRRLSVVCALNPAAACADDLAALGAAARPRGARDECHCPDESRESRL